MPNPGQPTVQHGDSGAAVSQAQRALRRTPNTTLEVDGSFGPLTQTATEEFQKQAGLPVTGVVDAATWQALPNGNPMPVLQEGSSGPAVQALQTVLTNSAPGLWNVTPQGTDGTFGPNTAASVRAFQTWARLSPNGVVGQSTWDAASALEFMVGLKYLTGIEAAGAPYHED
jgi:peptidoglycan hydrolase-like protein with peptidoglycan-binding domain